MRAHRPRSVTADQHTGRHHVGHLLAGGPLMTMHLTTDLAGPGIATSTAARPRSLPLDAAARHDPGRRRRRRRACRASARRPSSACGREGLFHILVPPELGGAGGTPRQWFDATLAVAHADASAGWIVAQGSRPERLARRRRRRPLRSGVLRHAADDRHQRRRARGSPSSSTAPTSCTTPAGPTCRAASTPTTSAAWS